MLDVHAPHESIHTWKAFFIHIATITAVQRGYEVTSRGTCADRGNPSSARTWRAEKFCAQLQAAELLVIDDLFLRHLPPTAGEELADVLMSRYEKLSTVATSNRPVEDWAALLGDVVTLLLDLLMHHGHLLKFEGKSWRLKVSAARLAKHHADA